MLWQPGMQGPTCSGSVIMRHTRSIAAETRKVCSIFKEALTKRFIISRLWRNPTGLAILAQTIPDRLRAHRRGLRLPVPLGL